MRGKVKKIISVVTVILFAVALASGCSKKEKEPPHPDVGEMIEEAIEAVGGGNLDEGMELAGKVLELEPDHPRAHCVMGTIYRDKGEYEKAIEKYTRAIELDPDYVICTHLLGFAYLKIGEGEKSYEKAIEKYTRAEEFLKKASGLDPAYAESRYDLGQLYAVTGRDEEAVAEFESFISLSKDEKRIEDARTLIEKIKSGEGEAADQED